MRSLRLVSFVAALLCGAFFAAPAQAQERTVGTDRVVTTGPSRSLLRSGALTLGLSYAPALVVGVTSPLPEDRYLLAPVAGPWLDLAKRECDSCRHEDLNRVLLVTDGIVQGFGAVEIVGAFLFVETRETTVARRSAKDGSFRLRFAPQRVSGGYGLKAVGEF